MTIFEAAQSGDLEELKKLIKDGADVNAKNNYGWTALIYAAGNGHKDCVAALIAAGADVNAKNDYGNTALMWASGYGHKECVELLEQAQRDLDAKNLGHTSTPSVPISEQEADNELKELDKSAQVPEVKQSDFSKALTKTLEEIGTMLLSKNASYGNAALEPLRIFSKADSVEQLKVRIDDKLSRLQRGSDIGEDTVKDLTGYLILFLMARAKNEN